MRGLRVPIVIGLLFCVLWLVGSGAIAQPSGGPYQTGTAPPTETFFASSSPPSAPPSGDITEPPSDPPTGPPSEPPASLPPPSDPPMQVTGADLTGYVVIGAALMGIGTLFVRVARRRRSSEA